MSYPTTNNNSAVLGSLPIIVKPTSRGRVFRIPNDSTASTNDNLNHQSSSSHNATAATTSLPITEGNVNQQLSSSSYFLWATREMAALDFLTNIPLRCEKDIVRAGLAGVRYDHRYDSNATTAAAAAVHAEDNNSNNNRRTTLTREMSVREEEDMMHGGDDIRGFDTEINSHLDTLLANEIASLDKNLGSIVSGTSTHTTATTSTTRGSTSRGSTTTTTPTATRWWDKLVLKDKRFFYAANREVQRRERLEMEEKELERPSSGIGMGIPTPTAATTTVLTSRGTAAATTTTATTILKKNEISNNSGGVPGRRLDGLEAITISIPEQFRKRPGINSEVTRRAAVREWEIKVAYNNNNSTTKSSYGGGGALLDGRVFFATRKSYPVAVYSIIKYNPNLEETLRRRKQLELLGGGGTQFVLPKRDWRGISYRALLPRKKEGQGSNSTSASAFNRLIGVDSSNGGSGGGDNNNTNNNNNTPDKKRSKYATKRPASPCDRDQYDNNSSSSGDDIDDDNDVDDTSTTSSSDGSAIAAGYHCGFLDDPNIVHGRNRNVMMGTKVTGPIISSTIQFVKPSVLKADLNKQFRERFDQYEPPKSQRKYICAKVIDGVYTLIDPTENNIHDEDMMDDVPSTTASSRRHRSNSIIDNHERDTIRMPPSLTLSKIRSLKQQALAACIRARIEISTLALAIIYFERLCLDCRVDKSNRRLSFAACLLLASKVNESNSIIAYDRHAVAEAATTTKTDGSRRTPSMTTWVKPSKKSGKIFESLIVFFTNDWSLSLKQLYAAEWIVFTALGFSLKAKPSEVAFHFKRLLRVLEWDPRSYLGSEIMYRQWQESLAEEFRQNERRNARHERRMKKSEQQLLKLQRKLHKQAKDEITGRSSRRASSDNLNSRRNSTTNLGMVHQSPGSYKKSAVTTITNSEMEKPNVIQSDNKFLTSSSDERSNTDVSPDRQHSKKTEGRGSRLLSRLRMHPSNGKDLEKLGSLSISSSSSSSNNTKSHLLPNNMPSQRSKSDNHKEGVPEVDQAVNLYRDVVLGRVSPIVETEERERQSTGDIS